MYRDHDEFHVVMVNNVWPLIRKDLSFYEGKDTTVEPLKSDKERTVAYLEWLNDGNEPLGLEE